MSVHLMCDYALIATWLDVSRLANKAQIRCEWVLKGSFKKGLFITKSQKWAQASELQPVSRNAHFSRICERSVRRLQIRERQDIFCPLFSKRSYKGYQYARTHTTKWQHSKINQDTRALPFITRQWREYGKLPPTHRMANGWKVVLFWKKSEEWATKPN